VRVKAMLDPAAYRRIKRNLFRVHNQFVSGNDRRAAYDYFMLLCGPLSAENQARSRDGGGSANPPAVEGSVHERRKRPAAIRPLASSLRGYRRQ
jgi:hypothetical protein